jgi:hypothetical protein
MGGGYKKKLKFIGVHLLKMGPMYFPMSKLKCLKNRWTSVTDTEHSGNPSISIDKRHGSPLLVVEGHSLRYTYSRLVPRKVIK